MISNVINEAMQMQKAQTLKDYTTAELLQELISREDVDLQHEGKTALLDVITS